MARNQSQQHGSLYVCTASAPWDHKAVPIMRETFSRAAMADLLLQVEAYLAEGFQVTITPPAGAPPSPSALPGVSRLQPKHIEAVDVQIIG